MPHFCVFTMGRESPFCLVYHRKKGVSRVFIEKQVLGSAYQYLYLNIHEALGVKTEGFFSF